MTPLAMAAAAAHAVCRLGRNVRPDTILVEFRENDRGGDWCVVAYEPAGIAFVSRTDWCRPL